MKNFILTLSFLLPSIGALANEYTRQELETFSKPQLINLTLDLQHQLLNSNSCYSKPGTRECDPQTFDHSSLEEFNTGYCKERKWFAQVCRTFDGCGNYTATFTQKRFVDSSDFERCGELKNVFYSWNLNKKKCGVFSKFDLQMFEWTDEATCGAFPKVGDKTPPNSNGDYCQVVFSSGFNMLYWKPYIFGNPVSAGYDVRESCLKYLN